MCRLLRFTPRQLRSEARYVRFVPKQVRSQVKPKGATGQGQGQGGRDESEEEDEQQPVAAGEQGPPKNPAALGKFEVRCVSLADLEAFKAKQELKKQEPGYKPEKAGAQEQEAPSHSVLWSREEMGQAASSKDKGGKGGAEGAGSGVVKWGEANWKDREGVHVTVNLMSGEALHAAVGEKTTVRALQKALKAQGGDDVPTLFEFFEHGKEAKLGKDTVLRSLVKSAGDALQLFMLFGEASSGSFELDLGEPCIIKSYSWSTSEEDKQCDPTQWSVEVSYDRKRWVCIHRVEKDQGVTEDREARAFSAAEDELAFGLRGMPDIRLLGLRFYQGSRLLNAMPLAGSRVERGEAVMQLGQAMTFEFPEPVVVDGYQFSTSITGERQCDPVRWTLEGSSQNDDDLGPLGREWFVLDNRSTKDFPVPLGRMKPAQAVPITPWAQPDGEENLKVPAGFELIRTSLNTGLSGANRIYIAVSRARTCWSNSLDISAARNASADVSLMFRLREPQEVVGGLAGYQVRANDGVDRHPITLSQLTRSRPVKTHAPVLCKPLTAHFCAGSGPPRTSRAATPCAGCCRAPTAALPG
jgi:hypothetical protein